MKKSKKQREVYRKGRSHLLKTKREEKKNGRRTNQ